MNNVSKKLLPSTFLLLVGGKSLDKLKNYQATKSSFHFPLDKPFPFTLIGKVVQEIVKKVDNQ